MSQLLAVGFGVGVARAEDAATAPAPEMQAPAQPPTGGEAAEMQNARAKALAGSKSPWSGQLQFTYLGSSVNHPFSDQMANPSHQDVPPPVNLSGIMAVRYRFSDTLTAGIGTGVNTETPFQGQKHTTVADPQVDVAKSFTTGPIHHRIDFTLLQYTSHSESVEYGLKQNFDVTSESFYETAWGLTSGLALEYDYNTLKDIDPAERSVQLIQDYLIMPYFEYAINETFNVRTIWHFTTNQTRGQAEGKWRHPDTTQNVGLGISASKAVFLYVFGAFDPYAKNTKIAADTTTMGLQAIINLF